MFSARCTGLLVNLDGGEIVDFVGLVPEFAGSVGLVTKVVDFVGLVPVSFLANFFCRYFLLGVRWDSSSKTCVVLDFV